MPQQTVNLLIGPARALRAPRCGDALAIGDIPTSCRLPQRVSGQDMCPLLVSGVTAELLPPELIRRFADALVRL